MDVYTDEDSDLDLDEDIEERSYSDKVDSDVEEELYGMIYHKTDVETLIPCIESDPPEILPCESKIAKNKNEDLNSKIHENDYSENEILNSSEAEDIKHLKRHSRSDDTFKSDTCENSKLYNSFGSPVRLKQHSKGSKSLKSIKKQRLLDFLSGCDKTKPAWNLTPNSSKSDDKNHNDSDLNDDSLVEISDDDASTISSSDSSIIWLKDLQSNQELLINNLQDNEEIEISDDDSDSSSMKHFKCLREKIRREIGRIDQDLNADLDQWKVNPEDKFRTPRRTKRYHQTSLLTCNNCNGKGHIAKFCVLPKVVKCYICGNNGHRIEACRQQICGRCYCGGHSSRQCRTMNNAWCIHCNLRGHTSNVCPDIWRRYHLTVSINSRIKPGRKNKEERFLYCYNCGQKGHFGAACNEQRYAMAHQTWPSVISYDNPREQLQMQYWNNNCRPMMEEKKERWRRQQSSFSHKQRREKAKKGRREKKFNEKDFPRTPKRILEQKTKELEKRNNSL